MKPARRGIALVLVLSLAVLLLLAVGALFQQGQDAVSQASLAEGRLALVSALENAAAEGWWTLMNPGRWPLPPEPAAAEPMELHRALRAADAPPGGPEVSWTPHLLQDDRTRIPTGGRLTDLKITARGRDRRVIADVAQGTIELRVTGRFTGDRVKLDLALVQLRAYWLAGPAHAPRFTVSDALVAQSVEEAP